MKQRIVNTKFYDDVYIRSLKTSNEKFLFLYLITNPLTNICGLFEIPEDRMIYDTAIEVKEIETILKKFDKDNKMFYHKGWLGIKNFIKNQNCKSDSIKKGIIFAFAEIPLEIRDFYTARYCLTPSLDPVRYLNLNFNLNLISKDAERLRKNYEDERKKLGLNKTINYDQTR